MSLTYKVIMWDDTVLPATRMFDHKWNQPISFTPRPQSITSFWLVLMSHPAEGKRLSLTWLDGYISKWFACFKMVTHSTT